MPAEFWNKSPLGRGLQVAVNFIAPPLGASLDYYFNPNTKKGGNVRRNGNLVGAWLGAAAGVGAVLFVPGVGNLGSAAFAGGGGLTAFLVVFGSAMVGRMLGSFVAGEIAFIGKDSMILEGRESKVKADRRISAVWTAILGETYANGKMKQREEAYQKLLKEIDSDMENHNEVLIDAADEHEEHMLELRELQEKVDASGKTLKEILGPSAESDANLPNAADEAAEHHDDKGPAPSVNK